MFLHFSNSNGANAVSYLVENRPCKIVAYTYPLGLNVLKVVFVRDLKIGLHNIDNLPDVKTVWWKLLLDTTVRAFRPIACRITKVSDEVSPYLTEGLFVR
jgi:hypothetical protein